MTLQALVNLIRLRGELYAVSTRKVKACRDLKDNKFLEAAVATPTDCIVSGDADLLDLVSFEGIHTAAVPPKASRCYSSLEDLTGTLDVIAFPDVYRVARICEFYFPNFDNRDDRDGYIVW